MENAADYKRLRTAMKKAHGLRLGPIVSRGRPSGHWMATRKGTLPASTSAMVLAARASRTDVA
jgi:hypothetical protein